MQGEDYETIYKSIKMYKYNESNMKEVIQEAVKWGESYISEKTIDLNRIYLWR